MNRKDFLRRSALLTLAAAGTNRIFAARKAYGTYETAKLLTDEGYYIQYSISYLDSTPLLSTANKGDYKFRVLVKYFKDEKSYSPTSTDSMEYVKDSVPKLKNGIYSIKFKLQKEAFQTNKPLPENMEVRFPEDAHLISLQTGKKTFVDLPKKVSTTSETTTSPCFLTTACTASRGPARQLR